MTTFAHSLPADSCDPKGALRALPARLGCLVALTCASAALAPAQTTGPTIGTETSKPSADAVDPDYLAKKWAGTDLVSLATAAQAYRAEHGSWPNAATLDKELAPHLSPVPAADPWGTPYRLDGEGADARLSSAGPDRRHGTPDDLVQRLAEAKAAAERWTPREEPREEWTKASGVPSEVARTHATLLTLSAALESFRAQRHHYPVADELAQLQAALVPEHLSAADWSPVDAWGHEMRYRANDVGTSYSLASPGADGAFERLVPLEPGAVNDPARDLVVTDGKEVRWPLGARPGRMAVRGGEPRAIRAVPPVDEPGRRNATRERLEHLAASIEDHRKKHGAYPEMDDAERLLAMIGATGDASDAWGNRLGYLTLAAGSRFVLLSGGADARFDHDLEDYLRGATPSAGVGGDIVVVSGRLLQN